MKNVKHFVVLSIYLALVVFLSHHHEVWRDEARALNIVTEAGGFSEIFTVLKNEGHPFLWYAALSLFYSILGSSVALKVASVFIAVLAAWVFISRSPFIYPVRCLWLFGFYPLYEYSVMSRNYGLGMLLIFLLASLFRYREERPLVFALLIALLAHSSAYGVIHALAFLSFLVLEPVFFPRFRSRESVRSRLLASSLALLGIALSAYTIFPEPSTVVTELHSLSSASVVQAVVGGIISHGSSFHNALVSPIAFVVPLLLICLYLLFMRSPVVAMYLFAVVVGMEAFNILVYSGAALRHQGFLLLAIVASAWIYLDSAPRLDRFRFLSETWVKALLNGGLAILFVLQIYSGIKFASEDLGGEFSSSSSFAEWLVGESSYSEAIVVAEPDYVLEAIPYYLPNRTYLIREQRFGAVVSFTSVSKRKIDLSELISQIELLQSRERSPILLLLPPKMLSGAELQVGYGRHFIIDSLGLKRLEQMARKEQCFTTAYTDENYCVWAF